MHLRNFFVRFKQALFSFGLKDFHVCIHQFLELAFWYRLGFRLIANYVCLASPVAIACVFPRMLEFRVGVFQDVFDKLSEIVQVFFRRQNLLVRSMVVARYIFRAPCAHNFVQIKRIIDLQHCLKRKVLLEIRVGFDGIFELKQRLVRLL